MTVPDFQSLMLPILKDLASGSRCRDGELFVTADAE